MRSHISWWRIWWVVAASLAAITSTSWAQPSPAQPPTARPPGAQPPGEEIPGPLRPWVGWVTPRDSDAGCPLQAGTRDTRVCAWPGELALTLRATGGEFKQRWQIDRDGWSPLPGDARRWPQSVRVNGQAAPVVPHPERGHPVVHLPIGLHEVTGQFHWDTLPEALPVAQETGLVVLTVDGEPVPVPRREVDGRLWLRASEAEAVGGGDQLEVLVHRRLTDDIPTRLATRINLNVAGTGREILLGPALPAGFTPLSLDSTLPARVEPDGRLRVQVRPGSWTLDLVAWSPTPVDTLGPPAAADPWPPEEVWVFEPRPALRLGTITGGAPLDPAQTRLPPEWRAYSAFRVRPGEALRFEESQRGADASDQDRLTLRRTLWLDFDGSGLTVSDELHGRFERSARLELRPPLQLGRVSLLAHPSEHYSPAPSVSDLVITRVTPEAAPGVEIRTRKLSLRAVSRLDTLGDALPAAGWATDIYGAEAHLWLPPGWRLLHASGPDEVTHTWLGRWRLLDLFLLLITALAVGRLFGWAWGAIALIALALSYLEPMAPRLSWLWLLAAEALRRAVTAGLFHRLLSSLWLMTAVGLIIAAIPFLIQQTRVSLHPILERHYAQLGQPVYDDHASGGMTLSSADIAQHHAPVPQAITLEDTRESESDIRVSAEEGYLGRKSRGKTKATRQQESTLQLVDPNAAVQTGPGQPRWEWTGVRMVWSGPVDAEATLSLTLLPPGVNRTLAALRALLICLLLLGVLGWGRRLRGLLRRAPASAAAALILPALLLPPTPARADLPSRELLEELRARLRPPVECAPHCADIAQLDLELTPGGAPSQPDALTLSFDLSAAVDAAIPLPGNAAHWSPAAVTLDGEPTIALRRDPQGTLWLRAPAGRHRVQLTGPLPARAAVQLALPLRPHHVRATDAPGWRLEGLHADGQTEAALELIRTTQAAEDPAAPPVLPPLLQVERTLRLGLAWELETRVRRLSPAGSPVAMSIPLVSGESVLTEAIRVEAGPNQTSHAQVSLGATQTEIQWRSALTERTELTLTAPGDRAVIEVWRLEASPVWSVATEGIPPVADATAPDDLYLPTWRPWPGEALTLRISRPAGIEGQTVTIDTADLRLTPGRRTTEATLSFQIRSSRGGPHPIRLPPGADVTQVTVNHRALPLRPQQDQLTLPLSPGEQHVQITWTVPKELGFSYTTDPIELNAPLANAELRIEGLRGRWILYLTGPTAGPAVLFWSIAIVTLLLAFGLGRSGWTPLRTHHWFLLGIGLMPTWLPSGFALVVVGWLLALEWRARVPMPKRALFILRQLLLAGWTLAALGVLIAAVRGGLLGGPDMIIDGNNSSGDVLRWFIDRHPTGTFEPTATLYSAPRIFYRLAMLAWALWMAWSLLRWLRWAWQCFTTGGYWPPKPPPKTPPPPQPAAPTPNPEAQT